MENRFPDSALDTIDKVLVLDEKETLTGSDIERLTRATGVRKLENTHTDDLDSFIHHLITRALFHKSRKWNVDIQVYLVIGPDVNSLMLALKINPLARLVLTTKRIKRLHNACVMKERLDDLLSRLEHLLIAHNAAVAIFQKWQRKNSLSAVTSQIERTFQGYAVNDLQAEISVIDDVMTDRW